MINKIKSNDISSINMEKSMQQGISFHQKGELQRAEKLYQRVLQNQPQNANAYHLLGIIAYQVGKKNLAIDLMNQAIGIDNIELPDYGDPTEFKDGEVPVFWACGVTPQAVAERSKPSLMITHSPGHMFVTDILNESISAL